MGVENFARYRYSLREMHDRAHSKGHRYKYEEMERPARGRMQMMV